MEVRNQKPRVYLSISDKLNILSESDKGVKTSILAEKYNVGSNTICGVKKRRESLLNFCNSQDINCNIRKIAKGPEDKNLENALYKWFLERRDLGEPITGCMLCAKAIILNQKLKGRENFKASHGWLENFKKRHGIRQMKLQGEKLLANLDAAVSFCFDFQNLIKEEEYDLDSVWNADETELIWKDLPEYTLVENQEFTCEGWKKSKERVSVLACGNATGNAMPLLVIGKFRNPRCLKNVKTLPVLYRAQKSAWMDSTIFLEWYEHHFIPTVKQMQQQNGKTGKVLLLLDNAKVHPPKEVLEAIDPNFKIKYFPPNVTCLIQPMNQGIIEKMKRAYRKTLLEHLLLAEDHKSVENFMREFNVKDCCYMVAKGFETLTEINLKNGWNKLFGRASFNKVEPIDECLSNENLSNMVQEIKGYETTTLQSVTEWIQNDMHDPGWQLSSDEQILDLEIHSENENCLENRKTILQDVSPEHAFQALNVSYAWARTQTQEVCSSEEVQVLKKLRGAARSQVSSLHEGSPKDLKSVNSSIV